MDKESADEVGRLYARIEYLRVVISILLSRLPESERTVVGVEILEHMRKHRDDALLSTFPDSYLLEAERYWREQLADAERRRQERDLGPADDQDIR